MSRSLWFSFALIAGLSACESDYALDPFSEGAFDSGAPLASLSDPFAEGQDGDALGGDLPDDLPDDGGPGEDGGMPPEGDEGGRAPPEGEEGGAPWFASRLIPGEALEARIGRTGALQVEEGQVF